MERTKASVGNDFYSDRRQAFDLAIVALKVLDAARKRAEEKVVQGQIMEAFGNELAN